MRPVPVWVRIPVTVGLPTVLSLPQVALASATRTRWSRLGLRSAPSYPLRQCLGDRGAVSAAYAFLG